MIDPQIRASTPAPIVLLYNSLDYIGREQGSNKVIYCNCEHSTLLEKFHIEGGRERDVAIVRFQDKNIPVKADPGTMLPDAPLSLAEKLTLRFEAALARSYRGETGVRVDLRFCTGDEEKRDPAQDNLQPNYGMAKGYSL